jgi:uncharacterized protein YjiS (DUF1127 family)
MDRGMAAVGSAWRARTPARVTTHGIETVLATLVRWRDRARQRRQLAQLDARGWADIGVTRSDAIKECAKPFWRA